MCNIKQNSIITGCLCALGCEILYGWSYMFTKQATELASPFALLGWRFYGRLLFELNPQIRMQQHK